MSTRIPYSGGSHEVLMGLLLGLALTGMAWFWWVWNSLH
jgi:hypothetical protein